MSRDLRQIDAEFVGVLRDASNGAADAFQRALVVGEEYRAYEQRLQNLEQAAKGRSSDANSHQ